MPGLYQNDQNIIQLEFFTLNNYLQDKYRLQVLQYTIVNIRSNIHAIYYSRSTLSISLFYFGTLVILKARFLCICYMIRRRKNVHSAIKNCLWAFCFTTSRPFHLSIREVSSFLIMFTLAWMCPSNSRVVCSVRNRIKPSTHLLQREPLTNYVGRVFDNLFKMSVTRTALQTMTSHLNSGWHQSINHDPTYYQLSIKKAQELVTFKII